MNPCFCVYGPIQMVIATGGSVANILALFWLIKTGLRLIQCNHLYE